jgi:hypothetical protein
MIALITFSATLRWSQFQVEAQLHRAGVDSPIDSIALASLINVVSHLLEPLEGSDLEKCKNAKSG